MTSLPADGMAAGLAASSPRSVSGASTLPRPVVALLRVPLVLKLVGANLVIGLATIVAAMATPGTSLADGPVATLLIGALVIAQIVNCALVIVALRPIRSVDDVASRVLRGDTAARVPYSPLADRDVARTGQVLNQLLDELMRERDRIRRLATKVIRAQDEECARIARELHDATAQTMAGVVLQLSVVERACPDEALAAKLHEIRDTAASALEEARTLSHTIYPRVLEDLGLPAALDWLARQTRETSGLEVGVTLHGSGKVPPTVASALYRVAQESLLNAVRHSSAGTVEMRLDVAAGYVTLEVEDDGIGFVAQDAEARRPGMGIFAMRERIALADGVLDIDSAPGRGCCVRARVPLEEPRLE
jgi:signal transduction histidine kinase